MTHCIQLRQVSRGGNADEQYKNVDTCTLNSIFPRLVLASGLVRTNSPKARDVSVPMLKSFNMPSILEVN